jgi:DNA-binding CsgD family transcriptional regulator/PAS domain-containing protein
MSNLEGLADFSSLVGRIYDAAVEPTLWPQVLELFCAVFNSAAGVLSYRELIEWRVLLTAEFGTDPHFSRLYAEHYSRMNPIIAAFLGHDVGRAFRIGNLLNLAEYEESSFYKEWAKPQGYGDLLGTVIHRDDRYLGAVSLTRRASDGPYDDTDTELFGLFSDHLSRAVRISDLFEHRTAAVATLETLLGHLAAAVVVIDEDERVLFVNASGRRVLSDSRAGRISSGRLLLSSVSVRDLINNVRAVQAYVATLPQRDSQGPALGLTAFALRGELGRKCGAPIAIFISGEETAPQPPPALLAEIYELTGGELRVLLVLLEGRSPDTIAGRLGISVATVRTHLARLFEKTRSTGQADLVRTVNAVVPPLSERN